LEDLIVKIKPIINKSFRDVDASLITKLYELSALSEKFTLQRPKTSSDIQSLMDSLDREGDLVQSL